MINYNELYERIQNGEKDIDIALSNGLSVSTLYKRFTELSLIVRKKRFTNEEWKQQYELYKSGKSMKQIVLDLDVRLTTVINHFVLFGYEPKTRVLIDKTKLYQDYLDGQSHAALARSHNKTLTYIRHLILQEAKKDL